MTQEIWLIIIAPPLRTTAGAAGMGPSWSRGTIPTGVALSRGAAMRRPSAVTHDIRCKLKLWSFERLARATQRDRLRWHS
eukprot:2475940-Pyramimonas_sp.AAC.1